MERVFNKGGGMATPNIRQFNVIPNFPHKIICCQIRIKNIIKPGGFHLFPAGDLATIRFKSN